MKLVYDDHETSYEDLISRFGTCTMLNARLKNLILEIFKSLKGINPTYIKELLKEKEQPYSLRKPYMLVQEKKNTSNFGLRTFKYLGSKLWNDLPIYFKDIPNLDVSEFKYLLKNLHVPSQNCHENPIV